MPTSGSKVKFKFGTASAYSSATKDDQTIYFTTDDHKIHLGSNEYGGGGGSSSSLYQHQLIFTGAHNSSPYALNIQIYNDKSENFQQDIPTMMSWLAQHDNQKFVCTGWIRSNTGSSQNDRCPLYAVYESGGAEFAIWSDNSASAPAISAYASAINISADIVTQLI